MPTLLLLLALAAQPPGFRTLRGTVSDSSGIPVGRAAVKLKNTVTLYIRSAVTRADGGYLFTMLEGDVDYEVWAVYQDLSSRVHRLKRFDTRKEAVIDLRLDEPRKASQHDIGSSGKGCSAGPSDRDGVEKSALARH